MRDVAIELRAELRAQNAEAPDALGTDARLAELCDRVEARLPLREWDRREAHRVSLARFDLLPRAPEDM